MIPEYKQERIVFLFISSLLLLLIVWGIVPPKKFPSNSIIEVPEGAGLYVVGELLQEENVIRSPFWFRTIAIVLGGERKLKAGQYYMNSPENVFTLAWRILHGDYNVETVKITIPEGFTIDKISKLFPTEKFTLFDRKTFEQMAPEGYLFPDTYFIPVTATASTTIKLMKDNFARKIFKFIPTIEFSKRTLEETIVMASLIEAEANNKEDREIISSILWKRLRLGMPLQVDSEKGTYEYQGLPKEPINNPGLVSIEAAISPTSTPYLYFLTGKDGKMYYAKTFEEHKANIAKYLR